MYKLCNQALPKLHRLRFKTAQDQVDVINVSEMISLCPSSDRVFAA